MPTVTLKTNASMTTRGFKFLRGVPRDDVPYELAVELSEDKRFAVTITKEEHQQAAFRQGGKPENRKARISIIASAISQLEQGNPEHFKTDGTPDARALTAILGWQVTKDERDAAWKQYNAPKSIPISPNAPKPEEKGDLTSEELRNPKKSLADKIIEREEAKDANPDADADDEDDDDLPPMDPEDGEGEGVSLEAVDENEGEEGEQEVSEAQPNEDKAEGGKKGGKRLVIKGGNKEVVADPTTDGAKEI